MIRFRTFSTVQLLAPGGERMLSVAAQPKRLALLAYLAVAHGGVHRRDTLVALLWSEMSTDRARAALRKALHYLREGLGPGVIITNGDEEVAVSETALECDARRFQQALECGELADAVGLYTGEFLPGLHVPNAPEFERWLDGERRRLCDAAVASAMSLAAREKDAGRREVALGWAHRAVALAPLDERPLRLLLELFVQTGDHAGALRAYGRYARALAQDLELEPSEELQRLVDRIRQSLNRGVESTSRIPEQSDLPLPANAGPTGRADRQPLPASGDRSRRRIRIGFRTVVAAAFLLATAIVGRVITASSGDPAVRSVAVLSLANLTGDSAQEYFVEGLTQALGAELARTRMLQVVSGVSAARYRNTTRKASQIARELGVDALVKGTVRRDGDRVQVTVDLVDGRTERRIWTKTFAHDVDDIFTLYREVAREIAADVSAQARDLAPISYSGTPTVNADSYDAYLRGEYFRKRWMNGGCIQAEHYFQRAIVLDSSFAAAYAGLATCYAHPDRLRRPVAEVHPKARAAAMRALELDRNLATAHTYLGYVQHRMEYDWEAAGHAFRRAVELNPGDPDARRVLGEFLYLTGRADDGLVEMWRSLELDPFHLDNNVSVGFGLRSLKRYDEAITVFAKTLEIEPHYAAARLWLAESYASRGNHDLAVREYQAWLRQVLIPSRAAVITEKLASAYERSGVTAFWRGELELCEEERRSPGTLMRAPFERHCGPYFMSRRYARLGDADRAIASLTAALEQRHHLMVFIEFEPLFESLRSDARFQRIVRRVHTPLIPALTTSTKAPQGVQLGGWRSGVRD